MKIFIIITMLFYSSTITAQDRVEAPVNPVALSYTSQHLGILGPVKTAGNYEFDKQGRLLIETGAEPKKFTYSKDRITVEKYGSTFKYKLDDKNRIISYSIVGKDDVGTYKYNKNGNLIEENDSSMRITYTYDDQNRLIKRTEWYGEDSYSRTYEYYVTPESLEITITVGDDRSSRVTNSYKIGVFVNRNFQGVDDWENVILDSHGNWTSYENVVYRTKEKREISYYE